MEAPFYQLKQQHHLRMSFLKIKHVFQYSVTLRAAVACLIFGRQVRTLHNLQNQLSGSHQGENQPLDCVACFQLR